MTRSDETIALALDLFWRKGYSETSMAEIVAATGQNRYALYSDFGSKREIFLAALDAYFEQGRAQFEPGMLDESIHPLVRIRDSLALMIEVMETQGSGCFICHVAIDCVSDDPAIERAVGEYFRRILEAVEITMIHAREAGVLNPGLAPAEAAQIFLDAKLSMGVWQKAGGGRPALERIASATLAALAGPGALDALPQSTALQPH
ncbi:MAG: TetR/AcrR family transcriptional regulator [Pseudomonadota bacterium]